jgi:capsular exopolysaccharide synthesis family protein
MDPVSLLLALRRRWLLAIVLGLMTGAVAAATVWYLWPPVSGGAQAQLQVNAVKPWVFAPEPAGDFNLFKRTQSMLVRNRIVIEPTLQKPNVAALKMVKTMPDPVKTLEGSMGAEYGAGSEVLYVTLGSKEDELEDARTLLNEIIDTYLSQRYKQSVSYRRLEILQKLQQPVLERIRKKGPTLQALLAALNMRDTHMIQLTHARALKELQMEENLLLDQKIKNQTDRFELEQYQEQLKQLAQIPVTPEEVEAALNLHDDFRLLREKVAEDKANLEKMSSAFAGGKSNKAYEQLRREVRAMENRLDGLRAKLQEETRNRIRQDREGKVVAEIQRLEGILYLRGKSEQWLTRSIETLQNATRMVGESNAEIEDIKNEIAKDRDVAGRLAEQIENLEVEMQAPDRVTRLGDAYVFPPSVGRKQIMTAWSAGFGAFGLVVFGIAWWEFRGRRISSVDEVVNNLGLRVVGALPALPERRGRTMPARDAFYPNYLIESVDTTRTMLLHAARRESLRTVMVTSANSGEGKTSLSIQLSASLARAGRKTLLIDGDMRNPAAHQVFNLQRGPGFSELVRNEIETAEAVQATSVRNLWMMPAGRWNAHTTELLSQEAVRPILERLKGEFDFIVVDSSPVLAAVDALLIGQQVDAVLFSILHEVSHSPSVYAAYQRLESLGVRILGAVVNGVEGTPLGHKAEYVYEGAAEEGAEPEGELYDEEG